MKKPIPNFLSVQGFTVMCDYRGVQKVCSRCRLVGQIGKDCATPRCTRCNVFGHATEGCIEPCRRCSGNHATADCIRPKSFAAAAAGEQDGAESTPPTQAFQEEQAPARESDSETVKSDVCSQANSEELEDLLPPSEKASSDLHTRIDTADSSSETPDEHDTSKPAAPSSFPSGDHTRFQRGSRGAPQTAPMCHGRRWVVGHELQGVQKPRSPDRTSHNRQQRAPERASSLPRPAK
ncbi:hypothetical protein MTO96_012498 [Rhipicephalus appendiculatus]